MRGAQIVSKILEVKDLVKKIGRKTVINEISFDLDAGKVIGVLGPNANGKTTLLNLIYGFMRATSGGIKICGEDINVYSKNKVSFLQDKNVFPKWMKVNDAIKFYQDYFEDFDRNKMENYLKIMKIERTDKINNLSKGTSEKLNLSLTLSRKTKLYVLDEPISGVDPVSRDKILDAIIDNLSEDSSLIITTHYVGELERIFDEVLFLGEGKILEKGNAEDLREKYNTSIDGIYKEIFAE